MDGSAAAFVEAIDEVGIRELPSPRTYLKVLKPIRSRTAIAGASSLPHSGFHLDVEIDFPTPLIGSQRLALEMNPGVFRNEICRARTFGFMRDVENLWKAGLALGASLNNTIALADDRIMNREGLRYPQEFVRHKMLDAMGDLALAGAPMLGSYRSGAAATASTPRAAGAARGYGSVDHGGGSRPRGVRDADPADVWSAAVNYAADRT